MDDDTRPDARPFLARVVAVVLVLASTILLMGLIDLFTLPGWVNQEFVWEVPLEASWGALFTFFLAGAYLWVALFPRTPWPALVQLGVGGVALLVGAAAGTDWRPLAVAAGVAASAVALWRLTGRPPSTLASPWSVRPALLAVALLGLALWLPYALVAFERSRAGVLGSVTQGIEHWPVQGAVGVALVLGAFTLAVWADGRPLLRVAVSLSAVYIGMAELAYPDRDGAMESLTWGIGVTLWGLLVALVTGPRHASATETSPGATGAAAPGRTTPARP